MPGSFVTEKEPPDFSPNFVQLSVHGLASETKPTLDKGCFDPS